MKDTNNTDSVALDEAWDKVCFAFPILNEEDGSSCTSEEFSSISQIIVTLGVDEYVESVVLDKISYVLRSIIVPEFWRYFALKESQTDGAKQFKQAVDKLYDTLAALVPVLERLDTLRQTAGTQRKLYGEHSLMAVFKVMIRASLHAQLPLNYKEITGDFYKISFEVFCNAENANRDPNDSGDDVVHCAGCSHEIENCECQSILQVFHETNRKLQELELLERLAGEVLTKLIHRRIESHVQETCKGSFDTSYITALETWLQTVVMGWLSRIYEGYPKTSSAPMTAVTPSSSMETCTNDAKQGSATTLTTLEQTLKHFLYETYTRTRIDQLFNIIIEYPESEPAISDLRICLKKTDMRSYLTRKLQHALETRLLHPGVNTPDILTAYVAAIRALRNLDPTGVLLETVTQPVRQYLRRRDDTVRCVITSLTEDGPSDLAEELTRGDATNLDEISPADDDTENWEWWMPDPVDADPSKPSKSRRTSDIISMLVNVYGSKELFVNEYRTLLADRLLSQFSYKTEKEIRYLELLKLRFGESKLHNCDVMLKDICDSKRINAHLHSEPNFNLDKQQFHTTAMILSAQFWPAFNKETLELPAFVQEHLDTYTKAFETFKGNRTLCWKPQLGSVNLEIELKDRKLNLTVSPIHATIIWHFQTKNQWTIEELSKVMKTPATVIRRKITYWQTQGILREVATDTLLLIEDSSQRVRGALHSEMVCEEEEAESAMASAHDQREEELQVFWTYIVGMLTNLDSMPLERILQMLKMFASQGPTVECSIQELRHFLDRKVREHELVFSGGFYRLPKS